MPAKDNITVNKIPLLIERIDHPQSFSRFEQLYLELIENKNRIKQNLINKDYVPSNSDNDSVQDHEILKELSPPTSVSEHIQKFTPETPDIQPKTPSSRSVPSVKDIQRIETLENQVNFDNESLKSFKSASSKKSSRTPSIKEEKQHSAILSDKLQNLLNKERDHRYSDKYNSNSRQFEDYKKSRNRLPTLSELEKQGIAPVTKELADASRLTIEDEDRKRELLFKFDLLKKSYKEQTIPTFTIHSDYTTMERTYEDTVRRLSLDSSVEQYKQYLIGAFMLIEFAFGKWLKFDMKGYTQQQITSMSTYEKLLIELGEKSYMPEGEQWSVEVRLVFMVLVNTAFFIVGKIIMNKTGSSIMNAINNMNAAVNKPEQAPKRKMQGPNINIDDLPDVSNF
jgi:hypothetical protein